MLIQIINSMLKGLNGHNRNRKYSKINKIDKTLRMTCLESNIFLNNAI